MKPSRREFWGVAALLLTAGLWSLNGPLIKLLSQPHDGQPGLTGLSIAAYRSLIGGLLFLPFAWPHRRTLGNVRIGWPITSMAAFTLMTISFVITTTQTQAANAIALQYVAPVVVFALSPWLLREKPGRAEGGVLSIVMAGVVVIFFGHEWDEAPKLLLGLLSGLGYGVLLVALRGIRAVHWRVVVVMNALSSGLLLLAALAIAAQLGRDTLHLTSWQFGWVAFMSIVQFVAPYAICSWAFDRVPASRGALILLLEMVLNPLWTWLAIGEQPALATMLGGSLILAGVAANLLLAWRRTLRSGALPMTPAPTDQT